MDWGLGNPNKTAVLIGMLMLSVWLLSYIQKWGFWAALGCFVSLGVCLMHTASRGGLISVCVGGVFLLWYLPRPWDRKKTVAVFIGICLVFVSSLILQTYSRYVEGVESEDRSITNRLLVWQSAPRMMLDAPNGWGIGNAGHAYLQWYQPLSHHEMYRTLVNSHLTWLVEMGWPLRFLYVIAWLAVLILCCLGRSTLFGAIPLAIWITFGVGAFFSSVAESFWLWGLPLIALIMALRLRWYNSDWPKRRVWLLVGAASSFLIVALWAMGSISPSQRIRGSLDRVVVGNGQPKVWVVTDNQVLGSDFGRSLRKDNPAYSVGLVSSRSIPNNLQGDVLIVCGKLSSEQLGNLKVAALHFRRLLLVNPLFFPQELPVGDSTSVSVLYGEFSHSPAIQDWRMKLADAVQVMPGVGDFVPDWPRHLLSGFMPLSAYASH